MRHSKNFSYSIIILAFTVMFAEAALSKFIGMETPKWFIDQFSNTILDQGPASLRLSFWTIAFAELVIAILFIAGLVRNEVASARMPVLTAALLLSQFLFVGLMFGLRISHKYADAAQTFFYALAAAYTLRTIKSEAREV